MDFHEPWLSQNLKAMAYPTPPFVLTWDGHGFWEGEGEGRVEFAPHDSRMINSVGTISEADC